jgi:hypothetical protein
MFDFGCNDPAVNLWLQTKITLDHLASMEDAPTLEYALCS